MSEAQLVGTLDGRPDVFEQLLSIHKGYERFLGFNQEGGATVTVLPITQNTPPGASK